MCKITIYQNNKNHTHKTNIFSDSDFQLENSSASSSTEMCITVTLTQ